MSKGAPAGTPLGEAEANIVGRLDRIPFGRYHRRVIGFVGTGTFFDGFDAVSVAVVLPTIVAAFGISFAEAGLILSAGYLGQFVGAIVIGALADRIGRRNAFVISLLVFGLMSLVAAFAWSATSLLVIRLIQGFGLGAEVPIAATLVNEYISKRNRGRVAMLYQSLFSWGLFFAPLIALLLATSIGPEIGWRVLMAIGFIPFGIAIWAWVALPESPRWLVEKGRVAEADSILEGMERAARNAGHTLPEPDPHVAVSKSVKVRFSEMFDGQYGRRTLMLAITWFFAFFVVYGYTSWLPTIYVSIGGLPPTASLALTVVIGVVQLAVTYIVAFTIERVGRKRFLIIGTAIGSLGALVGVVVVGIMGNTGWPYLFATALIMGVGMSVPASTLYLYTNELYPTRIRGFATASASSLNRLASVISPFVIGFLLQSAGGVGLLFAVFAVAAVVSLLAVSIGGVETKGRQLEQISS